MSSRKKKHLCLNFPIVSEIYSDWTGWAHLTTSELTTGEQKELTVSFEENQMEIRSC